ncbi:hypothetical protein BGZ61DRAFT_567388 [Ilyonectria robusta]|uniref:uncharacterized protein n=1 Tax=Ilyonectria robusta TaxID=1079257 RepID=UPI001E8CC68B|nr:uncharacterized protein BGZ61DRAFT_567388 [Ilyonectria robusta]KAH8658903.1 hypothetical protein BGZ61DRAFT_567388 [Ilyonectria robusta]
MHITGGQPARAPELLGVRMWNTINGGVQNIFIHEAMLVLPFWQNVQGTIKQKRRTSAFLWADEVVGEDGRKERKINTVVSSFKARVKEEKKVKREAKGQQREARKQRKEAKKQRRAEESIRMGRRGRAAGSEEGWEMVSDERETVEGEEEWEEQDGRDGDEVPDMESEDKGPDVEGEDEGPDVPEATPKPEEDQEEEAAFMEWFHEPKWTSDRARRVLQQYSAEYSGHELNINRFSTSASWLCGNGLKYPSVIAWSFPFTVSVRCWLWPGIQTLASAENASLRIPWVMGPTRTRMNLS